MPIWARVFLLLREPSEVLPSSSRLIRFSMRTPIILYNTGTFIIRIYSATVTAPEMKTVLSSFLLPPIILIISTTNTTMISPLREPVSKMLRIYIPIRARLAFSDSFRIFLRYSVSANPYTHSMDRKLAFISVSLAKRPWVMVPRDKTTTITAVVIMAASVICSTLMMLFCMQIY